MEPTAINLLRTIRRWSRSSVPYEVDGDYNDCSDYTENLRRLVCAMGFKTLGSGKFGCAIDLGDRVLKIFTCDDHAYLDFLDVCEKLAPCKHLPTIYWDGKINDDFWGVVMEKLEPFGDEQPYSIRRIFKDINRRMYRRNHSTGRKDLDALCDLLRDVKREEGHSNDLHEGNAMVRNRGLFRKDLVITDPWC